MARLRRIPGRTHQCGCALAGVAGAYGGDAPTHELGEQTFLIPAGIVVAALLLPNRKRRDAALLSAAVLGGTLVNEALKLLFRRARPDPFFGFEAPDSYAFPSGHAVSSVCFYGVLALLLAPTLRSRGARAALWTVAAALAGLVGLSRVYLGVHYPSDVLGGYALAVVWIATVRALLPMGPKPRRPEK